MEAQSNSSHFFKADDIFLAVITAIAASFLFEGSGFAAQCPNQAAEPVFTALASGPEIDHVRVEYVGQEKRNGKEPADLRLTLFRGKECVAQCRSTQPVGSVPLEMVDFRCTSTTLSVLESLATLRISENTLQLGSFLQGYRSYALSQPESRMKELAQSVRAEARIASADRPSPRENRN